MTFDVEELKQEIAAQKEPDKLGEIAALLSDSKTRRAGIFELADYCLKHFYMITLDNDEIYIYAEGVYVSNGKRVISSYVQQELHLGDLITTHVINELYGYIRRFTYKNREEIEEPKDQICLANGLLNLRDLSISSHTPDIVFFNKLPVAYAPGKDCPTIKRFLTDTIPEDALPVLQEVIGYCLYKRYHIGKAVMLVGGGANGKSTFINVLKAFLGPQNCSSIPLQELESNRFAKATLFSKLANLFADLSPRALNETSCFKMLTGEDQIPAEKKFQDHFFFTNYAKLVFSCNQIPRSPDDSDAFFRRWIIVVFPRQFLGKNADKQLLAKLTTPDELSGLLNYAIEGLRRLLAKGEFSTANSIGEVREQYVRQSDSVGAFIMDLIRIAPEQHVQKKELYTVYCDYCRQKTYPIVAENTFHRQLQAQIRVEDYRPLFEGRRVQCWRGITIASTQIPDNVDAGSNIIEAKASSSVDNHDKIDFEVRDVNDVKEIEPIKLHPIRTVQDVCSYIKTQDRDVPYEELLSRIPSSTVNAEIFLSKSLEIYKIRGDLYEPRLGIWRSR